MDREAAARDAWNPRPACPRLLQRDLLASAFQAVLRKPLLGRLTRHVAAASRRSWIAQLLRMELD